MRALATSLLVGVAVVMAAASPRAEGPRQDRLHVVAGLELDPPQERVREGAVKITAKVDAKDGAKVKLVWDVEAQFDEDVSDSFSYEVRDQGRSVQIFLPACSGAVRVSAVAIVDGEPTDTKPAKTYVVVKYAAKGKPVAEPPRGEQQPKADVPKKAARIEATNGRARVKAKAAKVIVVVDNDKLDEPDAVALAGSTSLKNRLAEVGVKFEGYVVGSAEYREKKAERFVADARGTPAVIYVTDNETVLWVRRIVKGDTAEDIAKEALGK